MAGRAGPHGAAGARRWLADHLPTCTPHLLPDDGQLTLLLRRPAGALGDLASALRQRAACTASSTSPYNCTAPGVMNGEKSLQTEPHRPATRVGRGRVLGTSSTGRGRRHARS